MSQLLFIGSVHCAQEKKNSLPCMPYMDIHHKNQENIEDLQVILLPRDKLKFS